MNQFKPLEWHAHEDFGGAYAAPKGLKWRYSIIVHNNGSIEFALLDSYLEYAADSPQFCTSVDEAKLKAAEHYVSILQNLIA